jgi:hypothetical protein
MRIRVRVDVRHPLKKEKKVKSEGGEWCVVNFKYEKLGIFCFVCRLMGHAENKCEVRFSMENDDGVRAWSNELRAEYRRRGGRPMSRWLTEEGGSSGVTGGRNNFDSEFNASGAGVVPTVPNSQSMQSQGIANVESHSDVITFSTANSVTFPTNNHTLNQLSIHPKPYDPQSSIYAAAHLLPNHHPDQPLISINQPKNNDPPADIKISEQLLPIYNPDKSIINQLSPINNSAFTSLSLSPIVTDNIKQQSVFSF